MFGLIFLAAMLDFRSRSRERSCTMSRKSNVTGRWVGNYSRSSRKPTPFRGDMKAFGLDPTHAPWYAGICPFGDRSLKTRGWGGCREKVLLGVKPGRNQGRWPVRTQQAKGGEHQAIRRIPVGVVVRRSRQIVGPGRPERDHLRMIERSGRSCKTYANRQRSMN